MVVSAKMFQNSNCRGAWWPSGTASDSVARGWGFNTYLRLVMSLSRHIYTSKSTGNTQKQWLRPDTTEKIVYWDVKP